MVFSDEPFRMGNVMYVSDLFNTDFMGTYDLAQLESYFQEWCSPKDLAGILRRMAMNLTIACLNSNTPTSELLEDLEDLKTFILHVEKVRPFS